MKASSNDTAFQLNANIVWAVDFWDEDLCRFDKITVPASSADVAIECAKRVLGAGCSDFHAYLWC